ncbi:MFS transporter [Geomicrobium sp. JSM 1781026]|uniref:MFS transporter n=1 Tax=Geomicrobium sp. JSM 1781026 TaxID=3344580 RepID=UPI0035BF1562
MESGPTVMNPWRMLIWLFIGQILIAFIGRSVSPLGVFIGDSLQLTNAQIGMLPAALFFGQFVASIPFGILVDRVGTKRLILVLSLTLGISFMLVSVTFHFILLLAFMAIGGIGYGAYHPVSTRGILDWFETTNRGTAMGIKQMGVTAGSALAAFLLVPLSDQFGWRPVLFISAAVLIIGGTIAYLFYRDPPKEKFTTSAGMWKQMVAVGKNRHLLLITVGAGTLSAGQMSLNTYLILYTNQVLLIPLVLAGMLLVISEISGSSGRIIWGIVSDKIFHGNRFIILCVIAIISAGCALVMGMLPAEPPVILLVTTVILFGFSIAGYNGIWLNAATEVVPKEQSGLASGFTTSFGAWGVILGPPLFGLITDVTGSFQVAWFTLATLMAIVSILFFVLHYQMRRS